MKTLMFAAAALMALTAPSFAGESCSDCKYGNLVTFTGYAGNPADTRSAAVFYGDIGCGPAGTFVMPSLSAPGNSNAVDYQVCVRDRPSYTRN